MRQVLQLARENNVVFNRSKLELCLPEVDYVGHVLSDRGVKLSPDKVAALVNMSQPELIPQVQTLLGMVMYTCTFLPNLSTMTEPLCELIKEGASRDLVWHWDSCHQMAFEQVKEAMASAPVLGYYTMTKPITQG